MRQPRHRRISVPTACIVIHIVLPVNFEVEEKMAAEDAEERGTSETNEHGIECETLPVLEI